MRRHTTTHDAGNSVFVVEKVPLHSLLEESRIGSQVSFQAIKKLNQHCQETMKTHTPYEPLELAANRLDPDHESKELQGL